MPNILVVDDEPRIVGFLRRSLSNHGFEVDGSLTGADALTRLRTKSYDLLLLDLMMPGIDGVQVLRAVGDLEHQPQVIIVSARSDVSAKVASLDLGAADYMTKPVALPELVARIRARLRSADPETVVRRGGISLDVVNTPWMSATGRSGSRIASLRCWAGWRKGRVRSAPVKSC